MTTAKASDDSRDERQRCPAGRGRAGTQAKKGSGRNQPVSLVPIAHPASIPNTTTHAPARAAGVVIRSALDRLREREGRIPTQRLVSRPS